MGLIFRYIQVSVLFFFVGSYAHFSNEWHASSGTIQAEWQRASQLIDLCVRAWDEVRMQNEASPAHKDDYNLLIIGLLSRAVSLNSQLTSSEDKKQQEVRDYIHSIIEHIQREYREHDALIEQLLHALAV